MDKIKKKRHKSKYKAFKRFFDLEAKYVIIAANRKFMNEQGELDTEKIMKDPRLKGYDIFVQYVGCIGLSTMFVPIREDVIMVRVFPFYRSLVKIKKYIRREAKRVAAGYYKKR